MRHTGLKTTFVIGCAALLLFNSCKKETQDTETTSATDNTICESEFSRMMPAINTISIGEPGVQWNNPNQGPIQVQSGCATISITTPNQFPVTMTVDYGTTGCTDSVDAKVRKGKIIIVYSGPFYTVGTTMTATFQDYYVNGIKFEGTTTVTRTGQYTFTQTVTGGKCTGSNNDWTILWDCARSFEWTQGMNTGLDATDDIVKITGTGSGTDRNGRTFSVEVTKPIIKSMGCRWIQEGTYSITPDGKPTRTVDFGSGTCDNKATITIEGNSFEFTMN